jgi:hypothetical protein
MRRWSRSLERLSNVTLKPRRNRTGRPSLECLEDRFVPAVFNVNSLLDLSIAAGVNPATGVINGTDHTVTVRSAIEAANATPGSNTINLTLPGTYRIMIPPAQPDDTPATENNATGDFDIIPNPASPVGSTLTIRNTSGRPVFVSGNHLDRIFDINPNDVTAPAGFTVVLTGFTIENGLVQPGDGALASGGGIRDQGNVSLTLTDMTVTNNIATADGGGIDMENAASTPWTLTINNSTISNNHAGDAGGGVESDGSGRIFINPGTVITGNTSRNQGAGIWLDAIQVGATFQSSNLTVNGVVFSRNSALGAGNGVGGGIGNGGNGVVTILNSTLANNFAGLTGGGFGDQNAQGTLIVLNSYFLDNTAVGDGGGIQADDLVTSITNTEIDGNQSGGSGGGLFANGVTLTVQSSTLANNIASVNGGGIELQTTGAGLFFGSTITDTTITGNLAVNSNGSNGGGIYAPAAFTGDLKLLNDTINANFADTGGGIFWAGIGHVGVQNTIIAGNFAGIGPDADNPAGAFIDLGGNLIGVSGLGSGNTGFTNGTTQTGTLANPLDPLLGPLQDNGGPLVGANGLRITLQTEAPLPGSPAIGKGILNGAPATDERGFPSVVDGLINVGAVSQALRGAQARRGRGDKDAERGKGDTDAGRSQPANADSILASAAAAALNPDLVDSFFATTPDQTGHHNGHRRGE